MVRVILTYNGLISAERQRCATQLPVWRAGIIAVQVCLASEFAAARVARTRSAMSVFPSKPAPQDKPQQSNHCHRDCLLLWSGSSGQHADTATNDMLCVDHHDVALGRTCCGFCGLCAQRSGCSDFRAERSCRRTGPGSTADHQPDQGICPKKMPHRDFARLFVQP